MSIYYEYPAFFDQERYLDRIEFHLPGLMCCSKERIVSNITPRFLTFSFVCLLITRSINLRGGSVFWSEVFKFFSFSYIFE